MEALVNRIKKMGWLSGLVVSAWLGGCTAGTVLELGTLADAFLVVPGGDLTNGWAQARATAKTCPESDDTGGPDKLGETCDYRLSLYETYGPGRVSHECCDTLSFFLGSSSLDVEATSLSDLDGATVTRVTTTPCYGLGDPDSVSAEIADTTGVISIGASTATVEFSGENAGTVEFMICE